MYKKEKLDMWLDVFDGICSNDINVKKELDEASIDSELYDEIFEGDVEDYNKNDVSDDCIENINKKIDEYIENDIPIRINL
jgi:hypothetical protein